MTRGSCRKHSDSSSDWRGNLRRLENNLHASVVVGDAIHAPVHDRVRANTWPPVNQRLDTEAQLRLREAAAAASSDELTKRITQLDYEWDFDRTLEAEASAMGLLGLALGVGVDKRFLGWCPPLPVFRRMGVRTRREINKEKYALKALRGDFDDTVPEGQVWRDSQ